MPGKTLDLRSVFGMIVTYGDDQLPNSPQKPFEARSELYPGGESAVHIHPNQDETYRVLEGEMEVLLDGRWRLLKAGEEVLIPKGAIHAFRNKGTQKAVALNRHNPGLRFGEMLETILRHIEGGKITSTKGFKNLSYMAAIMMEYKEVMHTVKPPQGLLKLMAGLGRLAGYKYHRLDRKAGVGDS